MRTVLSLANFSVVIIVMGPNCHKDEYVWVPFYKVMNIWGILQNHVESIFMLPVIRI